MKKLLLKILALFTISSTFAQTNQGQINVGASSNLSFTFQNGNIEFDGEDIGDIPDITTFEFSPQIGYFVVDNLLLGLGTSISSEKFSTENEFSNFEDKSTTFAIGPLLRYYFLNENIKPYLQGSIAYATNKIESKSEFDSDFGFENTETIEQKQNGFAFGFDAGVAFFLNKVISLDLGVGYARTSLSPNNGDDGEEDVKSKSNIIGAVVGFNLFF